MRVACAPPGVPLAGADVRFVLYGRSADRVAGSLAPSIIPITRLNGLRPAPRAWDLLSIALAVIGADEGCPRRLSGDGWTRDIELTVAVSDRAFWQDRRGLIERALGFLSTDRWTLSFVDGGILPAPPRPAVPRPEDCVCLLSGGLDSLVGALDLRASGRRPILVSQVAKGDKANQKALGRAIAGNGLHLQLNHDARPPPGFSERSQRTRSIVFIAYGVLAATCLDAYAAGGTIELHIPENGFISLNVPLTPLRLASHSTRTTHPHFLERMQGVLDASGIRVRLINPYVGATKGEMLAACADQGYLRAHAGSTTSCGRFARNAFRHCGRCVPCLIRRAAFGRWGAPDHTPAYRYDDLGKPGPRYRDFDDVRSAAMAVEAVRLRGLDAWAGAALGATRMGDHRAVVERGLAELGVFLSSEGVL